MTQLRKVWLGLLTSAFTLLSYEAFAQTYPAHDITLIVPYAPGGTTDLIARQFSTQLEKRLNAKVNVENKPGGSATIGTGTVLRAKPNGYTIGLTSNSVLAYQPHVNKTLIWKNPSDYSSIAKLVDVPTLIVIRADAPWKTFEEFIQSARDRPGKLRVSVSGIRTSPDLAIQQLNKTAEIKLSTIPFTGGGGEALLALLAGRVEANAGVAPTVLGQVQAGKVRVLAAFTKGQYSRFPEATSIVDAGYDVTLPVSYAIVAPKNLPTEIEKTLVTASMSIVNSAEFAHFATKEGLIVDYKDPQGMQSEMLQYAKTFGELIIFMDQKNN